MENTTSNAVVFSMMFLVFLRFYTYIQLEKCIFESKKFTFLIFLLSLNIPYDPYFIQSLLFEDLTRILVLGYFGSFRFNNF